MHSSIRTAIGFLVVGLTVAACGGGGAGGGGSPPPPPPPANFTVGGSVSGLSGAVVLQNNGADDLTLNASGAFTFSTPVASGSGYNVTIKTQPSSPAQVCTVSNGAGTVASANVTAVSVACVAVPLTLSSSVPADAATDVARTVVPTLVFSAAIDPTTAIPANFVLSASAGDQPVTVSVAGTQVTITPSSDLQPSLLYSLTVSTDVRGTAGEQLASALSLTFTTGGGAWGAATLIEADDGDAHNPETAIDNAGNAFAVWDQSDGTRASIWSNRATPAGGWGAAGSRENSDGDAFSPHVAVDGSGNALAVWQQSDGTRHNIWSSRYMPASGWSTPVLVENDPEEAGSVRIALNANGDGFAVWTQVSTIRPAVVWARRYEAASGWGAATRVQSNTGGDGFLPQIAIDHAGNAVAIWHQTDGARYNVWANRFVVGTGWEGGAFVENDNTGDAQYAEVGMDANGNAIAVWQQFDGTRFNIMSNVLPSGGSWGTAEPIENDINPSTLPQIAVNAAGEALAVWMHEQDGGEGQDVMVNRYVPGSGWGASAPLDGTDRSAILPKIVLNASGIGHAIWMEGDGTRFNIMASRYAPGSGWGAPVLIEMESGDAFNPSIAINASGTVQAIWRQYDGSRYNVWGNRFE
jgi:hypothetical protein